MNSVELLLATLAACMLKGIERVTPMLSFQMEGAEVVLEAIRHDGGLRQVKTRRFGWDLWRV